MIISTFSAWLAPVEQPADRVQALPSALATPSRAASRAAAGGGGGLLRLAEAARRRRRRRTRGRGSGCGRAAGGGGLHRRQRPACATSCSLSWARSALLTRPGPGGTGPGGPYMVAPGVLCVHDGPLASAAPGSSGTVISSACDVGVGPLRRPAARQAGVCGPGCSGAGPARLNPWL
jgi:hypothetical protein